MTRLYKSTDQYMVSEGIQYFIGGVYHESNPEVGKKTMKAYREPLHSFLEHPKGRIFEVEGEVISSSYRVCYCSKITFIKEIDYAKVFGDAITGNEMEFRNSILFNPKMPSDMIAGWVLPCMGQSEIDTLASTTDRLDVQKILLKETDCKALSLNTHLHENILDALVKDGWKCASQDAFHDGRWNILKSRDNVKFGELSDYLDDGRKHEDIIGIFVRSNIYNEKWLLKVIPSMNFSEFLLVAPILKLRTVDLIFNDLPYARKDAIIQLNQKVRKRMIDSWI